MAVKVRHPGVGFQIERDFQLMMRLAQITSLLPRLKDLRLEASLEQFSAPLREQVSCFAAPSPLLYILAACADSRL